MISSERRIQVDSELTGGSRLAAALTPVAVTVDRDQS